MKFVHCADIHLDSPLRGLVSYEGAPTDVAEIRSATRKALENLVDLCIDEQASFLVIAGDLYDGDWGDFSTGLFFFKQLTRLVERDIHVFIAFGNHDAESRITRRLPDLEKVKVFSSKKPQTYRLADLRVALHGQSYATPDVQDNLAKEYPKAEAGWLNIGVLHTALEGHPQHKSYAKCAVSELRAKGYDYWALGHVHSREIVEKDPWVVFPGCLQGRHIRETGPKGCMVVRVEDGRVMDVEPREVDVMRWVDIGVDARGAETPTDVLARIRQAVSDDTQRAAGKLVAVRVRVMGRSAAHTPLRAASRAFTEQVQAITLDAGLGRAWVESVKIETEAQGDAPPIRLGDDAMATLLQVAEEALEHPESLDVWKAEVEPFVARIPSEAMDEIEGGNPADPAGTREILGRARDLLLARLGGREGVR